MYGERNIAREVIERKCVKAFKDGHKNVCVDALTGWSSVITEDLAQMFLKKLERAEALRFNIYLMNFFKFQKKILYTFKKQDWK